MHEMRQRETGERRFDRQREEREREKLKATARATWREQAERMVYDEEEKANAVRKALFASRILSSLNPS